MHLHTTGGINQKNSDLKLERFHFISGSFLAYRENAQASQKNKIYENKRFVNKKVWSLLLWKDWRKNETAMLIKSKPIAGTRENIELEAEKS